MPIIQTFCILFSLTDYLRLLTSFRLTITWIPIVCHETWNNFMTSFFRGSPEMGMLGQRLSTDKLQITFKSLAGKQVRCQTFTTLWAHFEFANTLFCSALIDRYTSDNLQIAWWRVNELANWCHYFSSTFRIYFFILPTLIIPCIRFKSRAWGLMRWQIDTTRWAHFEYANTFVFSMIIR